MAVMHFSPCIVLVLEQKEYKAHDCFYLFYLYPVCIKFLRSCSPMQINMLQIIIVLTPFPNFIVVKDLICIINQIIFSIRKQSI